jgi:ankyrin repeat protein
LLLGKDNVDPNFPNRRGETSLWYSASNGHSAIVELVLQQDDIDPSQKSNGLTPLMAVARRGHDAVVRLLLGRDGVKIDMLDEDKTLVAGLL